MKGNKKHNKDERLREQKAKEQTDLDPSQVKGNIIKSQEENL